MHSSKLRIFQDDLLYTGYYATNEDDVDDRGDITDSELLKFDIEQFTEQRDQLIRDNKKCAYFLHDQRSSEWMEFKYFAMKLQFARQCATSSKNQGKAGQYLAKLLDLRNELMDQSQIERTKLEVSLEQLQYCKDHLGDDLVLYSNVLKDIDRSVIAESREKVYAVDRVSALDRLKVRSHRSQYCDEEKFHLFEDKLHKIVQLLKAPANVLNHLNNTQNVSSPLRKASKDKPLPDSCVSNENASSLANMASKKLIDTAIAGTSSELKAFQLDAQARMESCYKLTLKSLHKRDATRQAVLQGIKLNDSDPDNFREKMVDLTSKISNQERLLNQASTFREERRSELYDRHLQDMNRPEALVTQHRVQCMNRLKVRGYVV